MTGWKDDKLNLTLDVFKEIVKILLTEFFNKARFADWFKAKMSNVFVLLFVSVAVQKQDFGAHGNDFN